MGEQPVDLHSGQLLVLAGRLRGQLEAHYGKLSGAAAKIVSFEKWGTPDDFTKPFLNGESGYNNSRDAMLGQSGDLPKDLAPESGGSTLGVSFGSNGFGGLLDILDTAATETPDQDQASGKDIDGSGIEA